MKFWWWDDALDVALGRHKMIGKKYKIKKVGGWWTLLKT